MEGDATLEGLLKSYIREDYATLLSIELGLLLAADWLLPARVACFLRVRCMRSCRPFCCGWPGRMSSIVMPRRSHHTESFDKLNKPLGEERERRYRSGCA